MTIKLRCPKCKMVLALEDEYVGQKLACSACGQKLAVPPVAATRAPTPDNNSGPALPVPAKFPAPREEKSPEKPPPEKRRLRAVETAQRIAGPRSRSSKKNPIFLASMVGGGIVIVTLLGIVVGWIVRSFGPSAETVRYKDHIEEYVGVTAEQPNLGPYLRGRIVIILMGAPDSGPGWRKEVDNEVFPLIPAELHAAGPDDVGTVVVLKWSATVVGRYQSGATAMAHTCDARIVDLSLSAIVGTQYFRGSDPPASIAGGRQAYGTKPSKEIANWLLSLPREPGIEMVPPGWTVLFRSDDPAIWNKDSPGENFAVPLRHAHPAIRFLRLKRMDTLAAQIVPITFKQLMREDKPEPPKGSWWNGTGNAGWGGRHLGLAQIPPVLKGETGPICVSNHNWFTGSGFGHKMGVNSNQCYCWQGVEIPKHAFEIAVTAQPLSPDDERCLVK